MPPKSKTVNELQGILRRQDKRHLLSDQPLQILSNTSEWDFVRRLSHQSLQLLELLPEKFDPNVRELRLSSNQRTHIIRHLCHLRFWNVVLLDLGSNKLVSLEEMTRLDMPNLQRLNLYNNLITRIEPLRRCSYPNLIYLSLLSNISINCMNAMSEVNAAKLLWFWVEHRAKDYVEGEDLKWTIKLQAADLRELNIRLEHRIQNDDFIETDIPKRFPRATIKP